MRTSVAVLLAISVLFVGVTALSESAQQTKPTLNSSSSNASYNLSVDVFTGVSEAGGQALVYGGIAAIIIVSLGILVVAGGMTGGGR